MKKLPQPFEQKDIREDPKAVVIALLIGLLLVFGIVISVLYYRIESKDDHCDERIERLYAHILDKREQRIQLYEQMIFYKKKSEELEKQDSIMRSKTLPLINKIYNDEK